LGKKAEAFATDKHGITRKEDQEESRSICHGRTRNFTEGRTLHSEPDASATVGQESRNIATDEHGISRKRQKQRHGKKEKKYFRHGNKTNHSEPDA